MSDKNRRASGGQPEQSAYRKQSVGRTGSRAAQSAAQPDKKPEKSAKPASAAMDRAKVIRTVVKLFIALLIVVLIVLIWRNRVEWSCSNVRQCAKDAAVDAEAGEGFPLTIAGSRGVALDELSGNIAVLSDNMFLLYSSGSGELASQSHYMSSPALKSAGRYAIVYDIGSGKYKLEAASGVLLSGETENPIIAAAVSRSGTHCVVQQGSDLNSALLSSVEVFSLSGELLHKWHSAEYHITNAALSADGSCLALAGIGAQGGRLKSVIILQSVGSETELGRVEKLDNVYIDLEFSVNDVLFAVGSELLTIVSGYGDNEQSIELSGELAAYDVNYNHGIAVFTADDSGAQSGALQLFDARGRERCSVDVPLSGLSVSLYDTGCCVLGRGELRAYRNDGELYGVWETELGCSEVLAFGGRAYLLEGVKITQQRIRKNVESE